MKGYHGVVVLKPFEGRIGIMAGRPIHGAQTEETGVYSLCPGPGSDFAIEGGVSQKSRPFDGNLFNHACLGQTVDMPSGLAFSTVVYHRNNSKDRNQASLQTAPAPACKHCFGKELTEPSNFSDYDVNACGYYRLPADSYAAIDMGEPEVAPAMHAVISGPTSARTGREIRFSKFGDNMTTPSIQLRMDLEAMESELIQESTQASDDGDYYFISASKQSLLSRKQCLEQR